MGLDFNDYHVDPRTTAGDLSGRYPPNFVRFPWFTRPLVWGDAFSRVVKKQPAYLLEDRLLNLFDIADAPSERWGNDEEIQVLRENLALFSTKFDSNPYISPIGRWLARAMTAGYLKNRARVIAFYEKNRDFIEAKGRFEKPLLVTGFLRTGTTLLHRLLSEDPASRSPYAFEMERSTPPLYSGADPMKDPRIANMTAKRNAFSKMAPGLLEKFAEFSPVVSHRKGRIDDLRAGA